MKILTRGPRTRALLLGTILLTTLAAVPASAAVEVIGVQYQQDNPYPEYQCWYRYGNYPTTCNSTIVGANAHVFLKNTGPGSVTINGLTLGGYNLNTILKRVASPLHDSASIYYYWDDPPADVFNLGEPVWWKADPATVPAGGVARVVVRLRLVPVTQPIALSVATSLGTINTNVAVNASDPVLASVGFSADRTKVYLHWRRTGGAAPSSVWLDGTNVTSLTTTVGDPAMNFAVSVIQLAAPLGNMSYHVYQGVYADGKKATGSLRTWVNRFLHGTWGVREIPDNNTAAAQAWINDCQVRGVNCYVNNSSGGLQDYMATAAGQAYAEARDYGYVKDNSWGNNPRMWFIDDEPDLEEGNLPCGAGLRVPCGSTKFAGILGMVMVERGEALRAINPSAPTTINLDGNFKPDGWYAYGQLADVMMMDSYYEQEQAGRDGTPAAAIFTKPTSIYAASIATTTAAEPNPMHMILYSCEYRDGNNKIWPFAAPANKRIQVYYALAGGAKGLAYWWFKQGYPFNGLAANTGAAQALWNEIGRLGNEIKTAQPLLVTGHPVSVPLTPSSNVWARALASGTDTMVVFAVNNNVYIDQTGTYVTPVPNASVTIALPTWMQPTPTAFEITCGGLKGVNTQVNGSQLQINLGTLQVARMIVLTKDPSLLSTLQQRYDNLCRPGIAAFASESYTNIPLSIAQSPANLVLSPGGSGTFTVTAFGTRLKYRWQKNLGNLNDGGHYSGVTNATLTVSNADAGDEASYRCVVFTSYATNNSSAATLSLTTNSPAIPVATAATAQTTNSFTANWNNADGATSYRLDVSTNSGFGNFVSGYQDLNVGAVLSWNVTGLFVGTTYYYRVRGVNGNGASGNSGTISLTLVAPPVCPPTGLLNSSFEGGNISGVAASWTGYQRAPNPAITTWSIQTASPPAGAGAQYQQIANTNSTGGAGVRQNITGCVIGATYTISGWMRGNSGLYSTCTVKVSPTASTNWATAIHLTPAQSYTGSTWTPFGGTVVATGTNMTLWLDGQTTGSGNYNAECFDGIAIGCELTSVPPGIAQQPSPQSVGAGGNASFTVQAFGSDPLNYRWQKNSANLNDGGHFSGVFTPTLVITSADANDAGGYRCVVTNSFGATNSAAATLTVTNVAGVPPAITLHPTNRTVTVGEAASFNVLASGTGMLYYRWQKHQTNLNDGGHYSGVFTSTLNITGADTNDSGNYRCVVTNAYGSTNSTAASLTVVAPPAVCFGITNAGFEEGFSLAGGGYIANGWTEWEASPGVTIGYDETGLVRSGGHAQRIRVSSTGPTSGGVYQRVPVVAGNSHAIGVWIYAGDDQSSCSLGVDPTGGTNAAAGSVVWSSVTTNVAWVQKSWTGMVNTNVLTVFYKVASGDSERRNGYFDDATPALGGVPQLLAQRQGGNLNLNWPECPPTQLQRANSLIVPVTWNTVTNQPVISGGQKSVTLTPTGGTGYFRLVSE